MQSASDAQLPWHAVAAMLHGCGAQDTFAGVVHTPPALHVEGGVATAAAQVPALHTTPGVGVLQRPPLHVFAWHGLLSQMQEVPSASGTWAQPAPEQVSVVQSFVSSQSALLGAPEHRPDAQTSPVVHATPSVQARMLFA